ncbi:MAG: phosphotransferase [Clostridiales bacterium]|nr:phosphotransferase [Clostridiales bacterium]
MGDNKPLREVSIEGCEILGQGGNGAVYRLDDETIVKVYFGVRSSPEKISQNRQVTRDAFVQGVPTMIAFDMVKVGNDYGVIYEMINARSMSQEIVANPDRIEEYANLIADTLIKLHSTEFKPGSLPDSRDRCRSDIDATLKAGFYSQAEADRLYRLVDDIPYRNTFIHQDFHPGNMMYQNGEIMLIDVDDAGLGHPILDLSSMYLVYVTAAKTKWKTTDMGMTKKQFATLWDIIVRKYFNTDDPKEIAVINRILEGYSLIKMIRGVATSPSVPNILRKPFAASSKRKLFSMIDTLHPIP